MANLISLRLVVDTEKKRVVFAECNQDFVDILFSFLTLPMGTIVRLLDNNSGIGCFDKLYESIKNFDKDYLQTEACKTMLLQPRSAAEMHCENLKININDLEPRSSSTYLCPDYNCVEQKTPCPSSSVGNARCFCGRVMDKMTQRGKQNVDSSDCVFLKGASRFMITDDLHVKQLSTEATLTLLQRLGLHDAGALNISVVDVGKTEILSLLKATLKGKSTLTDVFLTGSDSNKENNDVQVFEPIDTYPIKVESNVASESKAIVARLLTIKSSKNVVYLEAGEDLVDQLFNFLAFPLGAIVKLLNKNSSMCCVDNLYHSVEVLGDDYIKSVECKEMLLSPKLATHFGCNNQLLTIDEEQSMTSSVTNCQFGAYDIFGKWYYRSVKEAIIAAMNPKLPVPGTEHGGGFVKKSVRFMVTNGMTLSPLSTAVGINVMKELQIPITGFSEREIIFGEAEVLNLLKVCLTSRAGVLNSIFYPKKRT